MKPGIEEYLNFPVNVRGDEKGDEKGDVSPRNPYIIFHCLRKEFPQAIKD